jgi:hypothetical protein
LVLRVASWRGKRIRDACCFGGGGGNTPPFRPRLLPMQMPAVVFEVRTADKPPWQDAGNKARKNSSPEFF